MQSVFEVFLKTFPNNGKEILHYLDEFYLIASFEFLKNLLKVAPCSFNSIWKFSILSRISRFRRVVFGGFF